MVFSCHSGNNKIIAQSETYKRKRSALKGVAALRKALGKIKVDEAYTYDFENIVA